VTLVLSNDRVGTHIFSQCGTSQQRSVVVSTTDKNPDIGVFNVDSILYLTVVTCDRNRLKKKNTDIQEMIISAHACGGGN
jgi:hypothetical protein